MKPLYAFKAFDDLERDVREGSARVREHPLLLRTDEVRGFVDVATGKLHEVTA